MSLGLFKVLPWVHIRSSKSSEFLEDRHGCGNFLTSLNNISCGTIYSKIIHSTLPWPSILLVIYYLAIIMVVKLFESQLRLAVIFAFCSYTAVGVFVLGRMFREAWGTQASKKQTEFNEFLGVLN